MIEVEIKTLNFFKKNQFKSELKNSHISCQNCPVKSWKWRRSLIIQVLIGMITQDLEGKSSTPLNQLVQLNQLYMIVEQCTLMTIT